MRILLAEDDELLGDGVRAGLMQYKYTVDWVKNGQAALQALLTESFDAVVLDLALPRLSGIEVLKTIRAKNISTPVLILTARDKVEDRVAGLDAGADDYLTKPFDLYELCARLRALLRRSGGRAEPILKYTNIKLDPAAHTVEKAGKPIELSRREFDLLQMLMENSGRVLSRENISQSLYGWGDNVDSNALEVHVHNLRKKFGAKFIVTIRGVGYMVKKEGE
ncbi:MAG: DNA-binding response regulator [Gammaproteobacteria bacterium GWE2_37_16]|nr:MAG: DNA-binding response regulator [Gammaproteobacteria bacterium GWE2_37_16]